MKLRYLVPAALLLVSLNSHAGLIHQYRFNGTLADDLGGRALVSKGGSLTDTQYVFGLNQGLALEENLGSEFTIDFLYSLDSQSSWRKLIDFAGRARDAGVYTNSGFGAVYNAGSTIATTGRVLNGQESQFTFTRNAAGLVQVFVNKQLVLTYGDTSSALAFSTNVANFFMDDGSGGEASAGKVDYLRMYSNAMTAAQVAALEAPVAPASAVPEPASGALMLFGMGMLQFARRKQRMLG